MNTNKRSVVIDLGTRRACALVALARDADAIVETRRPGELDALGIGFQDLRAGIRDWS